MWWKNEGSGAGVLGRGNSTDKSHEAGGNASLSQAERTFPGLSPCVAGEPRVREVGRGGAERLAGPRKPC